MVIAAIAIVVIIMGIYVKWWQLSAVLGYIPQIMLGGIVGVLLWGFRKRIKNVFEQAAQTQTVAKEDIISSNSQSVTTQKRQQLIDHGNDIIFEYKKFVYKRVRLTDSTWEEYLQGFRYRKELLQHLLTGHDQIYNLLLYNKTIESEKSYRETFNITINKVSQRVREEAQKLDIPENPIEGQQPEFNEESIVHHIVEEVQVDTWTGFSSDRDKKGARVIKSNNKSFRTNVFNQQLLDNLVLRLNDIARSSGISNDVSKCRSMQVTRVNNREDFNKKFEDLLRGIELRTKHLMGACIHCLHLHDDKDIPKLQSLLSQIE